jgi:hypothetical protein
MLRTQKWERKSKSTNSWDHFAAKFLCVPVRKMQTGKFSNYSAKSQISKFLTVFRIRDMDPEADPDPVPDPALFVSDLQDTNKK